MHAVVIIDDDEAIRETLTMLLEEHQLTVKTFADGYQALAYLAEHPTPHLVITDYLMPQMNGEAFLRRALEEMHLSHHRYVLFAARPLGQLPSSVEGFLTDWNIPFI